MKVEYKVCRAGIGFVINNGDIVNVSEAKADRLIEMGHAVIAKEDAVVTVEISKSNTKPPVKKKKGKKKK